MGGLPLPDVVRELLKEPTVLRWDAAEGVYEVLHGEEFERKFNELRKVRSKVKAAGTERPFSRMYNFYLLEKGDKWARTGTKFRPRTAASEPTIKILEAVRALTGCDEVGDAPDVVANAGVVPPHKLSFSEACCSSQTLSTRYEGDEKGAQGLQSMESSFRIVGQGRHLAAPPAAPRHQPGVPPHARMLEVLSPVTLTRKGSVGNFLWNDESPREAKGTLSEHIARAFREASSQHLINMQSPRDSSFLQRRASVSEDLLLGDYGMSAPAPIEIDDASSGFPSPECMLAMGAEFSGSPLDLGDSELAGFAADEHQLVTVTPSKDTSFLLEDTLEDAPNEAWATLHNAVW